MKSFVGKKIIIYGKGKAMASLCEFLWYIQRDFIQIDDEDVDIISIQSADIIIATPGIKPTHRLYREYGKKIMSELSFFWKLIQDGDLPRRKNVTMIWITATNGKSTTTWVLYQALQELKKKHTHLDIQNIYLGGNFDVPLSGLITRIIKEWLTNNIILLSWNALHLCYGDYSISDSL
jgi:UDP-N-acetylmuramoylalanine-D-glutamate ligase